MLRYCALKTRPEERSMRLLVTMRDWESGAWREHLKPDPRAESARHFKELGLSLEQFQGKDVIEVGCGATGVVFYLPEARRRVGIDPAAPAIIKWTGGRASVDLVLAWGEALPFADGTFDVAFCINCLDHTEAPEAVVREIARVLRPGGTFVFHFDIDSPLRKLHKALRPMARLLHPQSLTWSWAEKNILRNPLFRITATARDREVLLRPRALLYEAFWDNLIYVITGSKHFINLLWIAGVRC